jgi:hypothetical protein
MRGAQCGGLGMASDRIRACVETAMKIQQAVRDIEQIDHLRAAFWRKQATTRLQ